MFWRYFFELKKKEENSSLYNQKIIIRVSIYFSYFFFGCVFVWTCYVSEENRLTLPHDTQLQSK